MAPSFDNLADDENFDDVEIDYSGMRPRETRNKRWKTEGRGEKAHTEPEVLD